MRHPRISAALCAAVLVSGAGSFAPGQAASAASTCSLGQVALTFDDGPSATRTPRFLTLLRDRHVPATFFVVGERVQANPAVTRRAAALGFTIGNHSFRHENLTRLGDDALRRTLRRTRQAIVAAGVRPSALMRPPYGSINPRVRNVVMGMGLVPVLWTDDPRDWDGRSASAIVSSTLAQLRPRSRNIVLLHDGVRNSGQTLLALPSIIRSARARGYCFVGLGPTGVPTAVVPGVSVADASVAEGAGGSVLRATVTLDRATTRATSVRVRTFAASATAGADYVGIDQRVGFPAGVTRRVVRVAVRDDLRDEPSQRFRLRLSDTLGLRITDGVGVATILDDDPPPTVSLGDTAVAEPATGSVDVPVRITLSRPSEKWVRITVSTAPGTAGTSDYVPVTVPITFTPGQVTARVTVTVLADAVPEEPEQLFVQVTEASNVTLAKSTGVVTIGPPED